MEPYQSLFSALSKTTTVSIEVQNGSNYLYAQGSVKTQIDSEGRLILNENGTWLDANSTQFSNTLRWSLNTESGFLLLEHLRYGFEKPVRLICLKHVENSFFINEMPHVCGDDIYRLEVVFDKRTSVKLIWTVSGLKKNQRLNWKYDPM